MIFSSDELTFLCLVAKCPKPFGINLEKIQDDPSNRAIKAKQSLMDKGILTEDAITAEGTAVIKLWEEYCNASKFLICNKCVVALISDRRCVVSTLTDGGYDIASGDKVEVVYALLENKEVIRGEGKQVPPDVTSIGDYNSFRNRVIPFGENVLSIGAFDFNRGKRQERIFYWDEQNIYSFDPLKGEESIVDAPCVRRFIADGLELEKGI